MLSAAKEYISAPFRTEATPDFISEYHKLLDGIFGQQRLHPSQGALCDFFTSIPEAQDFGDKSHKYKLETLFMSLAVAGSLNGLLHVKGSVKYDKGSLAQKMIEYYQEHKVYPSTDSHIELRLQQWPINDRIAVIAESINLSSMTSKMSGTAEDIYLRKANHIFFEAIVILFGFGTGALWPQDTYEPLSKDGSRLKHRNMLQLFQTRGAGSAEVQLQCQAKVMSHTFAMVIVYITLGIRSHDYHDKTVVKGLTVGQPTVAENWHSMTKKLLCCRTEKLFGSSETNQYLKGIIMRKSVAFIDNLVYRIIRVVRPAESKMSHELTWTHGSSDKNLLDEVLKGVAHVYEAYVLSMIKIANHPDAAKSLLDALEHLQISDRASDNHSCKVGGIFWKTWTKFLQDEKVKVSFTLLE